MNNTQCGYTLGKFRREVFRALDEYSCNGEEQEFFSGGTGDIDKRFVSALNSAVRLVYLASARRPVTAHIMLERPQAIIKNVCLTLAAGETREYPAGNDTAVSFFYSGSGKLSFTGADGVISEHTFCSDYGIFSVLKKAFPKGTEKITVTSETYTVLRKMCFYGQRHRDCDERFLPDGRNVFCAFSKNCIEISAVTRHCGGRDESCPADIFSFDGGVLGCDENYCGEYTVEFFEYPQEFSENDSPEKALCLSPAACDAVVYAAAAELCPAENGDLYTRLTYKYREILANLYPSRLTWRKNSFFAGGRFGRRKAFTDFRG